MVNPRIHGARSGVATFVAVLVLVACAGGTQLPTGTDPFQDPPPPATTTPPPVPGSAGSCEPGSPTAATDLGIEITGVATRGELYGLVQADAIQPVTSLTVWWAIGGNGPLKISSIGPGSRRVGATGVKPAMLAGWNRPGEPWTSTISFPTEGCWRVVLERGRIRGDIWVQVA